MIDASHIKVHPHAAVQKVETLIRNVQKGAQFQDPFGRGCVWYAAQSFCHSRYRSRLQICLRSLICGIDAQNLLADKTYFTDAIVQFAENAGMNVVIPAKKNRKIQRKYDKYLYKLRLWLKMLSFTWNVGVELLPVTKNTTSFLGAVHTRCIALW